MKQHCWVNVQYSRRECLDIEDIPHEDSGEVVEEKVLNIFDKIGCSISLDHIESWHCISIKSDKGIAKFSRRKDCQQVWQVKKDLHKLKMKDFDLPGGNKLFIGKSLCPYYKVLCSKSKKLHSLGKTHSFLSSGDRIKIKIDENSFPLSVTHVDDFRNYFSDVNLSPPTCSS